MNRRILSGVENRRRSDGEGGLVNFGEVGRWSVGDEVDVEIVLFHFAGAAALPCDGECGTDLNGRSGINVDFSNSNIKIVVEEFDEGLLLISAVNDHIRDRVVVRAEGESNGVLIVGEDVVTNEF